MEKSLKIAAVCLSCLILALAGAVYQRNGQAVAEGESVGYVDSDAVLERYPEAVVVNRELSELRKTIEMELEKSIRLKFGSGDMSALPREQQLEVQKMFDDSDVDFQRRSEALRSEKWVAIIDAVNSAIEVVSRNEKLTVVLDKSAVIHGGVDLTEKVIEKLNEK